MVGLRDQGLVRPPSPAHRSRDGGSFGMVPGGQKVVLHILYFRGPVSTGRQWYGIWQPGVGSNGINESDKLLRNWRTTVMTSSDTLLSRPMSSCRFTDGQSDWPACTSHGQCVERCGVTLALFPPPWTYERTVGFRLLNSLSPLVQHRYHLRHSRALLATEPAVVAQNLAGHAVHRR